MTSETFTAREAASIEAELICAFMEPKPTVRNPHGDNEVWWQWGWRFTGPSLPQQETSHEDCWLPRKLTLDALREVEARLTYEQQWSYIEALRDKQVTAPTWWYLHASAEQKIKALSSVIRGA